MRLEYFTKIIRNMVFGALRVIKDLASGDMRLWNESDIKCDMYEIL